MKIYGEKLWLTAMSGLLLIVAACSNGSSPITHETIEKDYENIYSDNIPQNLELWDAIKIALDRNLDMRIAEQDYILSLKDHELQRFNALPSIVAKRDFITRSNDGASSSISAETGVQSLEPSISTDKSRWTTTLEANLDVLDSAINLYKAKSASDQAQIAAERVRKVQQNIISDVYTAYWRLAVTQTIKPSIDEALTLSSDKLKVLKDIKKNGDLPYEQITTLQNNIFSKRDELYELKRQMDLAEIEFKALLSIPPKANLKLRLSDDLMKGKYAPLATADIDRYVAESLKKRPEIREELLNLKISERNVKTSILETVPGISFLFAGNQDDNSFLEDSQWLSLTATLSQSITRLLTLPTRYARAKEEVNLANARRKALVAAVVSQVYIAQALYTQSTLNLSEAEDIFDVAKDKYKRSQAMKENGLMGGLELTDARLEYEVQRKKYYDQVLDLRANYARFMNVVGYDFIDILDITKPHLAYKDGGLHE